jgi:PAS domain S-box-containing protein
VTGGNRRNTAHSALLSNWRTCTRAPRPRRRVACNRTSRRDHLPTLLSRTIANRAIAPYGVVVASVSAGLGLEILLSRSGAGSASLLAMLAPVLVSSGFGGFAPGLLATVVGGVAGTVTVLHAHPQNAAAEGIALLTFCALGVSISWLNERLHRTARQAGQEAAAARQHGEALRASEERYRLLAESMHDIVTVVDAAGHVVFASPSTIDRLGWTTEELLGRPFAELVHPEDRERFDRRVLHCEDLAKPAPVSWRARCHDGTWRWLETNAALLEEAGGARRLLCTSRDVTDRKALEEQLRQAQRMEAIGRLAGGVAHDFNNVLTVILGYAANLEYAPDASERVATEAAEIRVAAERAARLTQQLLAFSRQQVMQSRVTDLNAVVVQLGTMLQRLIGTHIALELALDAQPWPVLVDPGQLEQVFMNLVVNARDAMPGGGTIVIRTATRRLPAGRREQGVPIPRGDWMVCEVTDTGSGMTPAVLARIFEPFFTTKPTGQGTGLGLSTVYGILKQSGGFIFCESAVGRGTTMRMYLPRTHAAAEAPLGSQPSHADGAGTVLVVEDEAPVRSFVSMVLKTRGYRILEASSGREALDVLRRTRGSIDALITDVIMPEMSGVEVARRITAERPHIPVLYMSGYADEVLRHEHAPVGSVFLQKPFTPDVLLTRLREVIEAPVH